MKFYTNVFQRGNSIHVREIVDGKRQQHKIPYEPYLFVPAEKGEYKTIHGKQVTKYPFTSIKAGKEFINQYKEVENFDYYGMTQFVYPFINDEYPGRIQYDTSLINIMALDIEVASDDGFPNPNLADKEVTAITFSINNKYVTLGCGEYDCERSPLKGKGKVVYYKCRNETELLRKFVDLFSRHDPDILTGWNVDGFDVPYLINRIDTLLGRDITKMLSPWGLIYERQDNMSGQTLWEIVGVTILDYMFVYKKWRGVTQESYKLDNIAHVELGEHKLDYSEYESLHELYLKDYSKFIDYNIRDTEIIDRLDDKLKLMDLAIALAFDAKINLIDSYTSVKMWDVIIHNYLMDHKIVVSQYSPPRDKPTYLGGYVKDPMVGEHDWVVSFDLNSLYPHLIMQYNISPEKYMGKEKGYDVNIAFNGGYNTDDLVYKNATITPNGCLFVRHGQGFLPALMEKMYIDRTHYKKLMLKEQQKYEKTKDKTHARMALQNDKIQHAKKIQLNSAYGALANQYFRWFNIDHAEAVTVGGQLSIRWIERDVNKFMNKSLGTDNVDYIIAMDTDSIYVNMADIVEKTISATDTKEIVRSLDKICEQIFEPVINKSYKALADYANAFEQKMSMKREAISKKGIWTAKKRYMLDIYNNEGVEYAEPKLKMVGIEAIRSTTPMVCRENIKRAIEIILRGTQDELLSFINKFKKEFYNMSFDEVAFPTGMNNINQFKNSVSIYNKGTPIHVKGALLFNEMIKKRKLDKKIEYIKEGDKVKYSYLKVPNPVKDKVISVANGLPPDLKLEKYIDFETQFEKAFISPLKNITKVIGWEVEKKATLDRFFT